MRNSWKYELYDERKKILSNHDFLFFIINSKFGRSKEINITLYKK